MYPESIKNLVDSFKSFPGIGEKTAERMAFNLLDFDEERIDSIQESIKDARLNIHKASSIFASSSACLTSLIDFECSSS